MVCLFLLPPIRLWIQVFQKLIKQILSDHVSDIVLGSNNKIINAIIYSSYPHVVHRCGVEVETDSKGSCK